MKFIYGNWIGKKGDWRIGKVANNFRCNKYSGVTTWGKLYFNQMNDKLSIRKGLVYEISNNYSFKGSYYSSDSLYIGSEKAFRRFIRKRIKPIETSLGKGIIIELQGKYIGQESIFYILE